MIPLFAIWGFWVTYFARSPETVSGDEHLHGFGMFAWVLMLVMQSFLIRTNRRRIHRLTGKLAYLLGPWIVISTILLAHYRLNVRGLTAEGLYILGLQVFILIQFTVCFAMAMRYRKQPDLHARWMICTAFSLLDPIFGRILFFNFIQAPFKTGIMEYFTYTFIDLIVIALIFRDWKSEQRRDVFLPVLILLLVTQLPTLFILKIPAWETFAGWFLNLHLT